jgi:hypothetical protein
MGGASCPLEWAGQPTPTHKDRSSLFHFPPFFIENEPKPMISVRIKLITTKF